MERERERKLTEAALNGSVDTLNALIKDDPVILDRVSTTWFDETPLHIAVLRGHIDFCKALLSEKPKFSTEVDCQGRLPLHLASVLGYVEIVKELLHVNPDTCLVPDHDKNIPLHLAVKKGRIEVIKELIQARPNSIMEKLDSGETALLLAVKHNHLEAFKLLVEAGATETGFVNSMDENGNTALQVATMHKRKEMVKYLRSRSGVDANELIATPPPSQQDVSVHHRNPAVTNKKSKIKRWMKNLRENYRGEKWYEERQGTLMLVATVFASITFQAALSPPGGVWQLDQVANPNVTGSACGERYSICSAGTSVLAYAQPDLFQQFSTCNTISLIASLSIILLIISGFPLKNKLCMWLLILTMCTTVVFMTLAYLFATNMVFSKKYLTDPSVKPPAPAPSPASIFPDEPIKKDIPFHLNDNPVLVLIIWLALILGLVFVARFLYWPVKRFCFRLPKKTGLENESQPLGA